MKKAIRHQYTTFGVESYYQKYALEYQNPHKEQIQTLLIQNETRISYHKVLDFCCGGGEVSLVLQTLGYPDSIGCDPFTHELYEQHLQKKCLRYSFEDVIRGEPLEQYSAIICSFAMHLCPEKKLYPLVNQLFNHSNQLIIITPHKRPVLETWVDFQLSFEDAVCTERGKKVFLKSYTPRYPRTIFSF